MSDSDEYQKIYRRIEDMAGVDRTPRLLEQINGLELSNFELRLKLLIDIGYQRANLDVWKHIVVLSQCEWTNLIIGIEPLNPNIRYPNPDEFNELIWSVKCWSTLHRLIADKLRTAKVESERPAIEKNIRKELCELSNNSYHKKDLVEATKSLGFPIPTEFCESMALPTGEIEPTEQRWIFRRLASNQWEIGEEGSTKRIKGVLGFHDLMFAIQNQGNDIELETMICIHVGTLPNHGADQEVDFVAKAQIRKAIADLQVNIDLAQSEGEFDLAEQYQADQAKYEDYLLKSTKPGGEARSLDAGNPKKKLAVALRDRQRTVTNKLKDAGLFAIAAHFASHYKITDYSVSYCPLDDSTVHWELTH